MHTSNVCWGWNPENGESKVFDSPEAREAEGWLDHHPLDEDKGGVGSVNAPEAEDSLSRDEIVAALTEGGIAFNKKAATKTLAETLDSSLRAALKARNVEFEEKASTRDLLALIKGH